MTTENDIKGAAVKLPPPLVFLTVIFTAYGIHELWPLAIFHSTITQYLGIIMIVVGFVIIILSSWYFKQAKTNIEPWKPTTTIISTGIYRYSRNPIYVTFCLIQIGIGLILNSAWILGSFIVSAIAVYHIAIKKEEFYLENKFGEEYINYKSKVRRWL